MIPIDYTCPRESLQLELLFFSQAGRGRLPGRVNQAGNAGLPDLDGFCLGLGWHQTTGTPIFAQESIIADHRKNRQLTFSTVRR
jgi:hypothetical protein